MSSSSTIGRAAAAAVATMTMTVTATGADVHAGNDPCAAEFEQIALPTAQGAQFTTVAIGPDARLYATAVSGEVRRWSLAEDGSTGATEILTGLVAAEGGSRLLIGLTFDPGATPSDLVAWVTHTTFGFSNMQDWGGKLTRLSGPNLESAEDVVVGLPRSTRDHVTNGVAFGADGAAYFLQGSNTAMGAPDNAWSFRPERLLTGALLRLDPALVAAPPVDVRTEDGGSYDPSAPGAPLTIYATGIRNAYDLVWHSNGRLYVPVNGSAAGGNTPGAAPGAPCADGSTYRGPAVGALTNVGVQPDFLYRVVAGSYYGHPNPARCELVMNGGNPTAGIDPAEVAEYPVGTQPDAAYAGAAWDFGDHRSPDGIIEYRSDHFDGALTGVLLVARYSQGDDIIALTPGGPALDIIDAQTGIAGFTGFDDPLDLVEDTRNGFIYVAEYGGERITLLRPVGVVICPADLDGSGHVGFGDLNRLLERWGPCLEPPRPPAPATFCAEDLDLSGDVGFADLSALLADWGSCG